MTSNKRKLEVRYQKVNTYCQGNIYILRNPPHFFNSILLRQNLAFTCICICQHLASDLSVLNSNWNALKKTPLWRRPQVLNIWFYNFLRCPHTGISFLTAPKKQIILEDYPTYMFTDLFLLVSAWLHLTAAQTPWKWKDINFENGQSKRQSK